MSGDTRKPTYDTSPSQPKLKLPTGSWDTHFHIFGPKARFPWAPGAPIDPADADKDKLFALHRHLGIERGVIVHTALHGTDLSVTEDALAATNGRYLGIALVPKDVSLAELKRLDKLGFRGARFHFMKHLQQAATVDELVALSTRLAEVGWHLQVHMENALIGEITNKLEVSAVPVVIDHMGRVDASQGLDQAPFLALLRSLQNPKFWVKVSGVDRVTRKGPPYADALPFARALIEANPDRVVWGTDWPHPHHAGPIPDDGQLVDIIAGMAPTEELRRKLMADNPMALYERRGL